MEKSQNGRLEFSSGGDQLTLWRDIRPSLHCDTLELRFEWLDWLAPYATELNAERYLNILREVALKGNSAQRQRSVFTRTSDAGAEINHNVLEFRNGHPNWLA